MSYIPPYRPPTVAPRDIRNALPLPYAAAHATPTARPVQLRTTPDESPRRWRALHRLRTTSDTLRSSRSSPRRGSRLTPCASLQHRLAPPSLRLCAPLLPWSPATVPLGVACPGLLPTTSCFPARGGRGPSEVSSGVQPPAAVSLCTLLQVTRTCSLCQVPRHLHRTCSRLQQKVASRTRSGPRIGCGGTAPTQGSYGIHARSTTPRPAPCQPAARPTTCSARVFACTEAR